MHCPKLPKIVALRAATPLVSLDQFLKLLVASNPGLRTCNGNPDYAKYVKSSDLAQPKHIQNESWHILGYEKIIYTRNYL